MNSGVQSVPDVSGMDWKGLYQFACEQAITGLVFEGVKCLGERGIKPPFKLLMEWIGLVEQIAVQNKILNKRCVEVVREYQDAGLLCSVLKGQGNSVMYPYPLSRTPGDIDILIRNANRKELLSYVRTRKKITGYHYHHVEYEENGVSVELHFYPCSMNNPIYHGRLQKWYDDMADVGCMMSEVELPDDVGKIPVPTKEFNIVFQLAHMMHHFFDEGIGLRQMIDYYYLLRNAKDNVRYKMEEFRVTLKYLNLNKFAGAVMYIMKEVLGLDEQYLIVPVDERRGKTLLNEIQKGGNFGHHSGLDQKNAFKKYFQKTWRNMQLVKEYPTEALCEPFFRTWHFFWRLAY